MKLSKKESVRYYLSEADTNDLLAGKPVSVLPRTADALREILDSNFVIHDDLIHKWWKVVQIIKL